MRADVVVLLAFSPHVGMCFACGPISHPFGGALCLLTHGSYHPVFSHCLRIWARMRLVFLEGVVGVVISTEADA